MDTEENICFHRTLINYALGHGELLKGCNLMLGKTESKRRRRQQGMRWLNNITNSVDMNLSKLQETVKDREAWYAVAHGVTKSQTWLSD